MRARKDFPYCYGYVTLRKKPRPNGGSYLYLDINANGIRNVQTLKCRLIDERTKEDRHVNDEALRVAQTMAQELNARITKEGAGFLNVRKFYLSKLMADYEASRRNESGERSRIINDTARHLQRCFTNYDSVILANVDKLFCMRFIEYLKSAKGLKKDNALSEGTQGRYVSTFTSALNYAVRIDWMDSNPMKKIEASDKQPEHTDSKREYLSVEELGLLMADDDMNDTKRAFLFSCFCGLRLSDVLALQHKHIERIDGRVYIRKNIIKTKQDFRICLSSNAADYLPADAADKEALVFPKVVHKAYISKYVERWAKRMGIDKHISFHCARHTFATLNLTAGTDIYTTSKLLGHTNVATTQIYAKIIDQKKIDAADALSSLFAR